MENKSCFNWIVRNNFADPDFWLINKGSLKDLGKPVKEFEPYYTGIKCPVLIWPDYGYYLCVYLQQIGFWRQYGIGSTNYKSLRITDIRRVFNQLSRQHSVQYNGGINVKLTY
ncbi:hypothetical protein [Trichormus variabilis]|uniref:Uncharacterized protein n=1 Tax=Trichormus variabilis SAG 1403-4b TaxID=447716 RepID=A0A433UGF1_ANAVA|nr:hypothetical protein [Trichormus variabilis]MBD2629680.1 hypothetical protein [Trichormus variabilis FACHB-164]RUS92902.1 hypothetical protein DSM107003_46490 [Trichormus variabilis SAG 1403-4b]